MSTPGKRRALAGSPDWRATRHGGYLPVCPRSTGTQRTGIAVRRRVLSGTLSPTDSVMWFKEAALCKELRPPVVSVSVTVHAPAPDLWPLGVDAQALQRLTEPIEASPSPRDAFNFVTQPVVVDHLARGSRKTAAKCESVCELQDTREHRQVERILRPLLYARAQSLRGSVETLIVFIHAHGALDSGLAAVVARRTQRPLSREERPRTQSSFSERRGALLVENRGLGLLARVRTIDSSTSQRLDHAPNLSISFSAGKETNRDSPSNSERTGISPAPNLVPCRHREMWCLRGPLPADATGPSPP